MNDWIEWPAGRGALPQGDTLVDVKFANGFVVRDKKAGALRWTRLVGGAPDDIVAWRVSRAAAAPAPTPAPAPAPAKSLEGGKLKGDHYYRVQVTEPISPEVQPYTAECADIIEALGMTFNEGEAFKALWRLAASRQGRGKPGNNPQYDADKVAHYGARVAACVKRGG